MGIPHTHRFRFVLAIMAIVTMLGLAPTQSAAAADQLAPSTPTQLTGTSPRAKTVVLSWKAARDNNGVSGYNVIRNGKKIGTANGTNYTDSSVNAGTTYWYRVQARDAAGNQSPLSYFTEVTVQGAGAAAPSQVTGLRGNSSQGKTALTWNASRSDAGIRNYEVTRSGKFVGTATGTTWTDNNVRAGTDYWYRITAVDVNGKRSAISDWIKVTGSGNNPAPPPPEPRLPVEPPPNVPVPNGWTMVWNDEFNGSSLNTTKWNIEKSNFGHPNGTEHCYTANNVVVSDGKLRLVARKQNAQCSGTNKNYTSGMVHTKNKVDWTYGRFEVRAKLTAGKGMFPAVWMSPADNTWGSWPRSGEIDIVEQIGQRPKIMAGSIHWGTSGASQRKVTEYFSDTRLTDSFHTYAIEWEPGVMRWYFDGQLYATSTAADGWSVPGGGAIGAPFNKDFYLIMNLSVGHDWPGSPDASTSFPNDLQIDYVRVYKR